MRLRHNIKGHSALVSRSALAVVWCLALQLTGSVTSIRGGLNMLDIPESNRPSVSEIQSRLHAVAGMLRESRTIDPASQRLLAELVDELSTALHSGSVPTTEVAHLAESTAHLADSLHQQQDQGVVTSARDRLETALLDAESRSNIVALARKLLDALANIGI
jgi:hypothetical protein